ncbi:MAG: Crp/Fnr family transcriptional regulator [Thermodesulfobacteriota bacterium]
MEFGDFTKEMYLVNFEEYKSGEIIFQDGDVGDWVYVITKGEVEISKVAHGKKIVIEVLKEGDVFGEGSFFDKQPRSATAKALNDVAVGMFDKEYLNEQYSKLPNNFRVIIAALVRRLKKMTAVAANLATKK